MKLSKTISQQPAPVAEGTDLLRAQFNNQAQAAGTQHQLLHNYVEQVRERQTNWLKRLTASPEERQMLNTFWKRQEQALDSVLEDRNAGLKLVGQAQLDFIREVCDSLLISTRSQIQLSRSTAFQERFLALNERLEVLNTSFFELVERKVQQLEQASGKLQELHARQLSRMLEQWEATHESLLDEFASIINRRKPDQPPPEPS